MEGEERISEFSILIPMYIAGKLIWITFLGIKGLCVLKAGRA